MNICRKLLFVFLIALVFLIVHSVNSQADPVCENTFYGLTPLTDLPYNFPPDDTYAGYTGGLYPNESNEVPAVHLEDGLNWASSIEPLYRNGETECDPRSFGDCGNPKVVLLSIGMSNTSREFGGSSAESFVNLALDRVDSEFLEIVNGAQSSATAVYWNGELNDYRNPDHYDPYEAVKTNSLSPRNLTEEQVQAVWFKNANFAQSKTDQHMGTYIGLSSGTSADAYILLEDLGKFVRTIKIKYPKVKVVFFSSIKYFGYSDTPTYAGYNAEPYAYENGFAVKWLIEAQIKQNDDISLSFPYSLAGPLKSTGSTPDAPWIAWGPYLWADGESPRIEDNLVWNCCDYINDGVHPSWDQPGCYQPDCEYYVQTTSGVKKVSERLLEFFLNSPVSRPWFHVDSTCQGNYPVKVDSSGLGSSSIQSAYDSANNNGDIIMAQSNQATFFIENLYINDTDKSDSLIVIDGGHNCSYENADDNYARLKGEVRISSGTVRLKNIRIAKEISN